MNYKSGVAFSLVAPRADSFPFYVQAASQHARCGVHSSVYSKENCYLDVLNFPRPL